MRIVISTVGTSLLTNQINRANPDERDWYMQLRDCANSNEKETPHAVKKIIVSLQNRAHKQLAENKTAVIRRSSAELNGLYGLYDNQLSAKQDVHFLISTDTFQCETTANVIRDFLQGQGLSTVTVYTPPGLSTASTDAFSNGIDDLIVWLADNIPAYKERGYQVFFNLVGGFKSLQGYLNTIGMFHADHILYIFEGQNAELISIPRLPITVDVQAIEPYSVDFALMDAGLTMPLNENIPEALILKVDGEMTLSTWGRLVWGECKASLLSKTLLNFPRLVFEESFKQDYKNTKHPTDKRQLQETLATVSCLLEENRGDSVKLKKDGGLHYTNLHTLEQGKPIGHFRVNYSKRVTCLAKDGVLYLRRYGEHDVIDNP